MKKAPCVSFESQTQAARLANRSGSLNDWVQTTLQNKSVQTILNFCSVLAKRGDQELALSIAQSSAMKERVVSGSRQLEDGSFGTVLTPEEGCIVDSEYRHRIQYLGIGA